MGKAKGRTLWLNMNTMPLLSNLPLAKRVFLFSVGLLIVALFGCATTPKPLPPPPLPPEPVRRTPAMGPRIQTRQQALLARAASTLPPVPFTFRAVTRTNVWPDGKHIITWYLPVGMRVPDAPTLPFSTNAVRLVRPKTVLPGPRAFQVFLFDSNDPSFPGQFLGSAWENLPAGQTMAFQSTVKLGCCWQTIFSAVWPDASAFYETYVYRDSAAKFERLKISP